jgi:hypothetical protein
MSWIEIALPGTILFVKFLLKLFVDKSATLPDAVGAVLALPVDIIFLAIALIAGFTIGNPLHAKEGLLLFAIFLGVSILNVFLWRRSDSSFVSDRHARTVFLALANFLISSWALVSTVNHLLGGSR